ncbi:toprim domain-containing protein [bacterium]|nr:toprim domain-containing protein [bacterium]
MLWQKKLDELNINARKTGRYTCPKCSQTRNNSNEKCLQVSFNNDAILYHCFHCQWSGKVNYENNFVYSQSKSYFKPSKIETTDNKTILYNYALKRGISSKIIDKYKIEINDNKEIIFQYFKDEDLVNIKYRTNLGNGKKTFRQEKDTEKTFYGMDEVKEETKELVIVEGEWDVLALAEVGIDAVSVPQGGGDKKLECIENCWGFLQRFENYIICNDNDTVGETLKNSLISRLGKEKCKIVNWDLLKELKVKDANELLVKDKNSLLFLIDSADYLPSEYIESFGDFRNEFLEFWENGYTSGVSTGWHKLDEIFTIKTGRLMIITGIPTRGKSFFTDNLLFNLSKQNGYKNLICSFEINKTSHLARLMSMATNKSFDKKIFNYISKKEIEDNFDFFKEHFFRFEINRAWDVAEIIKEAEIAVKRFGIKILVIDPYNRLNNEFSQREDIYVGKILSQLINFAKKNDVLVIFIAHPTKIRDKDTTGNIKAPSLYDISGSANWYNMCDYGVIIHRDRDAENGALQTETKIIVAKVKDFELGNPSGGTITLHYNYNTFKLEE